MALSDLEEWHTWMAFVWRPLQTKVVVNSINAPCKCWMGSVVTFAIFYRCFVWSRHDCMLCFSCERSLWGLFLPWLQRPSASDLSRSRAFGSCGSRGHGCPGRGRLDRRGPSVAFGVLESWETVLFSYFPHSEVAKGCERRRYRLLRSIRF